jgi:hypothetical protein
VNLSRTTAELPEEENAELEWVVLMRGGGIIMA